VKQCAYMDIPVLDSDVVRMICVSCLIEQKFSVLRHVHLPLRTIWCTTRVRNITDVMREPVECEVSPRDTMLLAPFTLSGDDPECTIDVHPLLVVHLN
jgi:hypothetical protein